MSTPLEAESELQIALRALNAAEAKHSENLALCVQALHIAAAELTNDELHRWTALTGKIWRAQNELARRHGDPHSKLATPSPQKRVRAQTRRSWLGNIAGITLPVALFGTRLIDHGFVLPLFWMSAVGSDVLGRATCLHLAQAVEPRRTPSPDVVMHKVEAALNEARSSARWSRALRSTQTLATIDSAINAHDAALKHGRRFGKTVGIASALLIGCEIAATRAHALPQATAPWATCAASLVAIFGLACWLTSFAYTAVLEQPPYPVPGSAERVVEYAQAEARLFKGTTIGSSEDIDAVTTNAMRKQRVIVMALRELRRSERFLDDTQWRVAELQASYPGQHAPLANYRSDNSASFD